MTFSSRFDDDIEIKNRLLPYFITAYYTGILPFTVTICDTRVKYAIMDWTRRPVVTVSKNPLHKFQKFRKSG